MRPEIERVVQGIQERYGEDLSLADLAEIAGLSPFHMARLFRMETGLPPVRFLTAVRMEEARRRLLCTTERVLDISVQVGYTSLGTFTSRFTRAIGVSPGRYRRLALLEPGAGGFADAGGDASFFCGSILGRSFCQDGLTEEVVCVTAFPVCTGSARPVRCRWVERSSGSWCIAHVPEGIWTIEAVSEGTGGGTGPGLTVGRSWPVRVLPGAAVQVHLIRRNCPGPSDPLFPAPCRSGREQWLRDRRAAEPRRACHRW